MFSFLDLRKDRPSRPRTPHADEVPEEGSPFKDASEKTVSGEVVGSGLVEREGGRTTRRGKGSKHHHYHSYGGSRGKMSDASRFVLNSGGSLIAGFFVSFILLTFFVPGFMEFNKRMSPSAGTFTMARHAVGLADTSGTIRKVTFRGITAEGEAIRAAIDAKRAAEAEAEENKRKEALKEQEIKKKVAEEAKKAAEKKAEEEKKAKLAAIAASKRIIGAYNGSCGPLFDPRKVTAEKDRDPKIVWVPQPRKFLLAYCYEGDINTRLVCFRNTVILAAALNRTVIVPMKKSEQYVKDYDLRMVFHLETILDCYGPDSVISSQDYQERYGKSVEIDRLHCWHGPYASCLVIPDAEDKGCPATIDVAYALDPKLPHDKTKLGVPTKELKVTVDSLLAKFFGGKGKPAQGACLAGEPTTVERAREVFGGITDSVLAVGDMRGHPLAFRKLIYPTVQDVLQGSEECRAHAIGGAVGPHPGFFSRSHEVRQILVKDKKYIALHWPWAKKKFECENRFTGCHYPPAQAARCAARLANLLKIDTIFLTTDAPEEKVWDFLVATQASSDQQRKFVRLPLEWAGEMGLPVWFKRLFPYGNFTSQLALGEMTLEKLLAARSTVFIGSRFSSFTDEVVYTRYAMKTSHCNDTYLCFEEDERVPIPDAA